MNYSWQQGQIIDRENYQGLTLFVNRRHYRMSEVTQFLLITRILELSSKNITG